MRPYAPLARDDELALARRWRDHGDISARDRIVLAHLPLAHSIAAKCRSFGMDRDEMRQQAVLGLFRAIETFDPERGLRFSTYAKLWARSVVDEFVIRNARTVCPPLTRERRAYLQGLKVVSIETPIGDDGTTLADTLPDTSPLPDELAAEAVDGERRTARLSAAIASLAPRDRAVIEARFSGEVSTLDKVGKSLGISKERVRQIECAALKQLKKMLAREVAA